MLAKSKLDQQEKRLRPASVRWSIGFGSVVAEVTVTSVLGKSLPSVWVGLALEAPRHVETS
jgi:hypothetical protein